MNSNETNGTENTFNIDDAIIDCQLSVSDSSCKVETGYIDNLQQTYGFIRCTRKNDATNTEHRLFFHKSACSTSFECLKIGDFVEFEEKTSKNKPVATRIKLTETPVVTLVEGSVNLMPKKTTSNTEDKGSLMYKYSGEFFFLPFAKEDIKDGQKLKTNDEIMFEVIQDKESGKIFPMNIQKKNAKERICGVVTSLKERFGFIERGDIVKEIYFNLAEAPLGIKEGSHVEFTVKHLRNGKEEAVGLKYLPDGTVVFHDVYPEMNTGTVLRAPVTRKTSDQSPGCISYDAYDNGVKRTFQLPFNESDRIGGYTLMPGDKVEFQVAVDRRDQLQRAHNVQMNLEVFLHHHKQEIRKTGVVRSLSSVLQLNDSNSGSSPYVLIEPDELAFRTDGQYADSKQPLLVQFKIREWFLTDQLPLLPFTPVTYTPLQVTRQTMEGETYPVITALRVLPAVDHELTNLKLYESGSLEGQIVQPAVGLLAGIITTRLPHCPDKVTPLSFMKSALLPNDSEKNFQAGETVCCGALVRLDGNNFYTPEAFNITRIEVNGDLMPEFVNNNGSIVTDYESNPIEVESSKPTEINKEVKICGRFEKPPPDEKKHRTRTMPEGRLTNMFEKQDHHTKLKGWITINRDSFGFIESQDYKHLYKFTPSPDNIMKPGYEVEFHVAPIRSNTRSGMQKRIAENVKVIPKGTLPEDKIVEENLTGTILRELTISDSADPNSQYHGVVEDDKCGKPYPFTMKSLYHFRTKLVKNDKVRFSVSQIGTELHAKRACKVTPINDRITGKIASIKTDCGYIEYTPVQQPILSGDSTMFGGSTMFIKFDAASIPANDSVILMRNQSPKMEDRPFWTDLVVGDLVNFHLNVDEATNEQRALNLRRTRKNSNSEGGTQTIINRKPLNLTPSTGIRKRYGRTQVDEMKPRVLLVRGPRLPPDDEKCCGFTNEYKTIPPIVEIQ